MLVYYILWGIIFILAMLEVNIFQRKACWASPLRGIIVWLIWSIFVFIIGFKGNVGTDYGSYILLYESVNEPYSFGVSAVEPLFWLWMKVCSWLSFSFPIFWFVTAMLNISLKLYIFRHFSPFVAVSVLIYIVGLFFERDFDGIRQGLSIGLCYLACLQYLKGKASIEYNFIIVCATLVHYTGALFFLIPLLSKIRLSNKFVTILISVGLVFVLANIDIMSIIFDIIGMDNMLYDKMYSYMKSEKYSEAVGINVGLIFRIIIFALFIKYKKAININEELYNLLKNGFLLSIFFSLLFGSFEILSHRLAYGFREFQIFIIPSLILAAKGTKNRLLVTGIIAMYSLILLSRLLSTPHLTDYYIYKLIFNQ